MLVYMYCKYSAQCLKKIHVRVLGQVDFFAGQVTLQLTFLMGKSPGRSGPMRELLARRTTWNSSFCRALLS